MKIILYTIILVACAIWIASPVILFKPFRIEFDRILFAIGIILILTGIHLIHAQGKIEGRRQAIEVIEEINEELKSKE